MKKTLIVLACIALVLPLFALSAFAETMTPLEDGVAVSSLYFDLDSVEFVPYGVQTEWSLLGNASTYVNGQTYLIKSLFIGFNNFVLGGLLYYDSPSGGSFNVDLTTRPDWSGVITLSTPSVPPSGFVDWYNSLIPPPSVLNPVNDGVNTFIGYGGDVLHFITNNSTLLFLIGLSVGLCLVIPFGVSKIKDLLKGY